MSMQLAMSVAKNEFIVGGKYRLLRKIGSGSFGDIYLGINISNGEVRSTVSRETDLPARIFLLSSLHFFLSFHPLNNVTSYSPSCNIVTTISSTMPLLSFLRNMFFFMILLLVTRNIHCFPLGKFTTCELSISAELRLLGRPYQVRLFLKISLVHLFNYKCLSNFFPNAINL